jgi:hypothetical protein
MRTPEFAFATLLAAGLLCGGAARADRVVGIAGISAPRPATVQASASSPAAAAALRSGVVSGLSVDGTQIEIDGKWYRLKPGRSLLLRNGLPVDTGVLAKGQKLRFSLASQTPGEQALGVVHVP